MWGFSFFRALGLMVRTAPFLLFRMLVYFGIMAALYAVTGAGAAIGFGIGLLGDEAFRATATLRGAAVGFGLVAGVVFYLRDHLLHSVKAGHIAVMVAIIDRRPVPGGQGQIAFGREAVAERFGQTSALIGLDRLIGGVIGGVIGATTGLAQVLRVLRADLMLAAGLVAKVVLAHAVRSGPVNPWEAAQRGLVYYMQNARQLLISATWLTLISWALTAAVFGAVLEPAAAVVWLLPAETTAAPYLFAAVFAWAVKAALIEPFALACMLQVFFRLTDGQEASPQWAGRLTRQSDKFRQIGDRAWSAGQA